MDHDKHPAPAVFNVLGILGSAALASVLDMILIVGHYLAVPVLYVCIWKVTHADLFPDAVFTAVISYALMFGVDLFFLETLMGDLRPSARSAGVEMTAPGQIMSEEDLDQETNAVPAATRVPDGMTAQVKGSPGAQPGPVTATNAIKPGPSRAEQIASQFTFKGLTRNAQQSALVLHTGVKTYTLIYGKMERMRTKSGTVPVRFEELGNDYVVLNVDGETVKLSLR